MTTLVIQNMDGGNTKIFKISYNADIEEIIRCIRLIPSYRNMEQHRIQIRFRSRTGEYMEFEDKMKIENVVYLADYLYGKNISNLLPHTERYIELSVSLKNLDIRLFEPSVLSSYSLDYRIYHIDLMSYYNKIKNEPEFGLYRMATIWAAIIQGEPEYTILENRNNQPILRMSHQKTEVTTLECYERMELIGL